ELPGKRGKQEERENEQRLRDGAELELLRGVRIELIGDEQHHRLLNRLSLNAPRNWVANRGKNRRARSKWVTFWIKAGRGWLPWGRGRGIASFAHPAKRYNSVRRRCCRCPT